MFKVLFFSLFLFSTQASITDRLVNSFKSFVERFSGATTKKESWNIPAIPQVDKDHKSAKVQKVRSAGKLSERQIKQYNQLYVEEVFKESRKSSPTINDVTKWYGVLSQGGSNEGVYRALVLDQVYRGLENLNYSCSQDVQNFASDFFNKFLGKNLNHESLATLNFYFLKKRTVEQALEIVDAYFSEDNNNIYQWYGALGAYLATHYPKAFKSKVRSNTDSEYHRTWGMSVSDQIIKSEVIVKIHKVYNYLQR